MEPQNILPHYFMRNSLVLQKLAQIFHNAAEDGGYVDPQKVVQILQTTRGHGGYFKYRCFKFELKCYYLIEFTNGVLLSNVRYVNWT